MAETAQSDPVSQFQALPPERQKALLGKMSPQAKANLKTGIDKKLAEKKAAKTPTQESATSRFLSSAFRGAGGVSEEEGKRFFTHPVETAKGMLEAQGELGQRAYKEAKSGEYVKAATHGVEYLLPILGPTLAKAGDQLESKDYAGGVGTMTGLGVSLLAAKALPEAPKAVEALQKISEKGIPPSLTKAATKPVIQKLVMDRALKVKEHISNAAELVKKEDAERWQHIEKTIDEAKPEGAIDLSQIKQATGESVKQAIQTPQKLAPTVETMQKGSKPPVVAGSRLDFSNPAHRALYERLKETGAFPDEDSASFAKTRQLRSKLGRELRSGTSTLSGESKAVGWKLYGDLTDAMKKSAEEHGMGGAFDDANAFHKQYMQDFVDKDAPLGKAMQGENAHEVMNPLSSQTTAEQSRRVMAKYRKYGLDPEMIDKEGTIFQRLKTGLPKQIPFSRFELASELVGLGSALTGGGVASEAALVTPARLAFNLAERVNAIRQASQPNPIAVRAQALKAASETLGPKASVREIMAEADKTTSR